MSSTDNNTMPRLDRASSISSTTSSSTTSNPWLVLSGSSTATTPNAYSSSRSNPFLQLSPVTRTSDANKHFRPTECADDRQRLFLLRARDN